jgi:hypothetical protein
MASIPDVHVTLQVDGDKLREAIKRELEKIKLGKCVTLEPGMVYNRLLSDYSRYDREEWVKAMQQHERRLKRFAVSSELLCTLFISGTKNVLITHGLPPDAVVRNVRFNFDNECFEFVVWHPLFDVVGVGNPIPIITVYCRSDVDKRDDTTTYDEVRITNVVE